MMHRFLADLAFIAVLILPGMVMIWFQVPRYDDYPKKEEPQ